MSARLNQLFTLLLLALAVTNLRAAQSHTQPKLILAAESAKPGETVLAGVQLRMDPHWHIYWRNPGVGIATSIKWQLPPGVTAGKIQWPVPRKLTDIEFTTYIYENEVVLLVPLKIGPDVAAGPVELNAKVSWLECESKCIPGSGPVHATLNIGNETTPSADASIISSWQKKLPGKADTVSPRAWWEKDASGKLRPVIVEWQSKAPSKQLDFFPDEGKGFEVQPAAEPLTAPAGLARVRLQIKKSAAAPDWPKEIFGLLVEQTGPEPKAYDARLSVADSAPAGTGSTVGSQTGPTAGSVAPQLPAPVRQPLWLVLIEAFIGGLILNIMPCVLPVIALKILGFVRDAGHDPARIRKLGFVYTAGVLLSFLTCGILVVALQKGWGVQFGNPYFLIGITTLVTLIALNLFGVFEVTLGAGAASAAGSLASKQGAPGAFFNGLLTTVLATSCSAPFFAAAVGFAATLKSPAITLLIFLIAGLGLASPYLLLAWNPGWLKFLPKPGPWMERFKVAMGFPMIAVAVWLYSVTAPHYADRGWWLVMFLVFVGVAAWVYGEFVQRSTANPWVGRVIAIGLLVLGYAFVLENKLEWRQPDRDTSAASTSANVTPKGVAWEKWSPEAVAAARASGRPVVVDFTADWCLNCNLIIKPSFEDPAVQKKLKETKALPLVADYSRQPDNITEELKRFGRAAVPLVVVYSPKPDQPPMFFDLVLPSTLVEALEKATQ